MRELFLLALVAVLGVVALFRPRWGALGYVWYALMRPDVLAWSYGHYNYGLFLSIPVLLGSLRHAGAMTTLVQNPISAGVLALQVPMFASALFAVDQSPALDSYSVYARILAMALILLPLSQTVEHLRQLLLVMALSVGFLGLKFGAYALLHGGVRYDLGHGGLMSDNNDLALALAMTVPLCWYARSLTNSIALRLLLLCMVFASSVTVVMTHSRGGALSLLTAFAAIALRARRRLALLLVFALCVGPAVYLVRDSYLDRLATLKDPTQEVSANSRLELAQAAIDCWKDYPVFGVGFGGASFMRLGERYLPGQTGLMVHNTYLQILVDSGAPALAVYVILLFGTIVWLGRSAARVRGLAPLTVPYPYALQASLAVFAVGSTFLSRVTFDMTYMLLMASACWYSVEKSVLEESAELADPAGEVNQIAS
jgi:probable O-glycosylation ligase (exosortase A-associated)